VGAPVRAATRILNGVALRTTNGAGDDAADFEQAEYETTAGETCEMTPWTSPRLR
jgi:hypothetical protein